MYRLLVVLSISVVLLFACEEKPKKVENESAVNTNTEMHKIEVMEHMNAAGYTYILASEDGNEFWIAVAQMPVEVGETMYYNQSMEMKNFKSKALDRTFDSILFVEGVSKDGKAIAVKRNPMMGSSPHSGTPKIEKKNIKVEPISGGITVEELYSEKSDYEGKTVMIKGVVTKFNGGIMNRNWIHIQDGTSHDIYKDITVTSDQIVKVGETIVIEGKLILDKDFGSGYKYDAIIEEAKVLK